MKRIIFICLTFMWAFLILYLSFQGGEDTANTSLRFTQFFVRLFYGKEVSYDVLMLWDTNMRLLAHFGLFFLYGIWAMLGLEEKYDKQYKAYGVSFFTGISLAVFSEVGKLRIEGRHCDLQEMLLNCIGVTIGIIFTIIVMNVIDSVFGPKKKAIN